MSVAKQSDLTPAQHLHIRRMLWLLLAYAIVIPTAVCGVFAGAEMISNRNNGAGK